MTSIPDHPDECQSMEKVLDELRSIRINISDIERRRDRQFAARLETSSMMVDKIIKKFEHIWIIVGLSLGILSLFLILLVPHYTAKNISGLVEKATIIVENARKERAKFEDSVREEIMKNIPEFQVRLLDVNKDGIISMVMPDGLELEYMDSRFFETKSLGKRQIMYFRRRKGESGPEK